MAGALLALAVLAMILAFQYMRYEQGGTWSVLLQTSLVPFLVVMVVMMAIVVFVRSFVPNIEGRRLEMMKTLSARLAFTMDDDRLVKTENGMRYEYQMFLGGRHSSSEHSLTLRKGDGFQNRPGFIIECPKLLIWNISFASEADRKWNVADRDDAFRTRLESIVKNEPEFAYLYSLGGQARITMGVIGFFPTPTSKYELWLRIQPRENNVSPHPLFWPKDRLPETEFAELLTNGFSALKKIADAWDG